MGLVARVRIEKRVPNFVRGNILESVRGHRGKQVTVKAALSVRTT